MCDRIIYGCMVQNAIKHERKYFGWSIICDWSVRVRVDNFSPGFYSSFYYGDTHGKIPPLKASVHISCIHFNNVVNENPACKKKIDLPDDQRLAYSICIRTFFSAFETYFVLCKTRWKAEKPKDLDRIFQFKAFGSCAFHEGNIHLILLVHTDFQVMLHKICTPYYMFM